MKPEFSVSAGALDVSVGLSATSGTRAIGVCARPLVANQPKSPTDEREKLRRLTCSGLMSGFVIVRYYDMLIVLLSIRLEKDLCPHRGSD